MSLIQQLLSENNGGVVKALAQNFNLSDGDATNAIRSLAPALAGGMKRNAQKPGGLEALMGALQSGKHQQYVDQPDQLASANTVSDGNAILGHLFGSKDVSRNVAGNAAKETGLDSGILKKMLPMVAAAAMGSLGKKTQGGGGGGMLGQLMGAAGGQSQGSNLLSSLLDTDGDGSSVDDMLSMAKKFF